VGACFSAPAHTVPEAPPPTPHLLYNWYRVFPEGKERPGCDADLSPTSNAVGHKRIELYLYSPYGLHGLHRTSVPVQGCTLPFFMRNSIASHLKIFIKTSLQMPRVSCLKSHMFSCSFKCVLLFHLHQHPTPLYHSIAGC
jgi:hypothetical protein